MNVKKPLGNNGMLVCGKIETTANLPNFGKIQSHTFKSMGLIHEVSNAWNFSERTAKGNHVGLLPVLLAVKNKGRDIASIGQ